MRHVIHVSDWNSPAGNRFPFNGTSPADAYDTLVHQVWPILTVYFPPANTSTLGSVSGADADMTCIRASNIKEGSRVPPPLPKAQAVRFPRPSSWYGLRVGLPIGLVLLAAIALVVPLYIRRRKKTRLAASAPSTSDEKEDAGLVQKDGRERYQLAGKEQPIQLPAEHKVEMSAGYIPRRAIESTDEPQELMGNEANVVKS